MITGDMVGCYSNQTSVSLFCVVVDDQCYMMIGPSCCHGNIISCKAWFLRSPDEFVPLAITPILHQMITHRGSGELCPIVTLYCSPTHCCRELKECE